MHFKTILITPIFKMKIMGHIFKFVVIIILCGFFGNIYKISEKKYRFFS